MIEKFISKVRRDPRLRDAGVHCLVRVTKENAFHCLVGAILSTRTRDEVTAEASRRLLRRAPTPEKMLELSKKEIAHLIYPVGFYKQKASSLLETCGILMQDYGGRVPSERKGLLRLPGVGLKVANLVLNRVFKQGTICVDTHVHRIVNRWGIVKTKTPEMTERELEKILPHRHRRGFNELLVAFGQRICTPVSPRCSTCPVVSVCPRIAVTRSR